MLVRPDGSHTDTVTETVKRLTSGTTFDANKFTEKFPFDSVRTKLTAIKASVLTGSGEKRELPPDSITTKPLQDGTFPAIETAMLAELVAYDFQIGDTLEIKAMSENTPLFPGAFTYHLPHGGVCGREKIAIHMPKNMRLSSESHGLNVSEHDDSLEHIYEWTTAPEPTREMRCSASATFDIVASSIATYDELARLYNDMIGPMVDVTPEIQSLADRITLGVNGHKEKAARIHDWLASQIAYIGPSANMNWPILGQASWIPARPAVSIFDFDWKIAALNSRNLRGVVANGKGNILEHAILYKTLLQALGIESELVLLNRDEGFSIPLPATLYSFNYAILWIPEFGIYDDETTGISDLFHS
jgi:hypothetical protein